MRDALELKSGDSVVFRVEGARATITRTPDLLALAGTFEVPAEVRGMSWTEIIERTYQDMADHFEP